MPHLACAWSASERASARAAQASTREGYADQSDLTDAADRSVPANKLLAPQLNEKRGELPRDVGQGCLTHRTQLRKLFVGCVSHRLQ